MSTVKVNTIENVAGTESHDVDTMGITRGGDASGWWIKYPDGSVDIGGQASKLSSPGGTVSVVVTIPITILEILWQNTPFTGTSAPNIYLCSMLASGVTSLTIYIYQVSGTANTRVIHWSLKGRWK